jgi:hypothetical protein
MPARKEIAPDVMAECRMLYEQTLTPVHEIWTRMGLSRDAFYIRVREEGWQHRRGPDSPLAGLAAELDPADCAEDSQESEPPAPVSEERRAALRARNFRAVEKQMDTIERILASLQAVNVPQSERAARIISNLNRAMRETEQITRPEPSSANDAADPDAIPRDLDALRLELARRIHAFFAERHETDAGGGAVADAALDGGLERRGG